MSKQPFWKRIFGFEKAVPAVAVLDEQTRDGIQKAYIPKFIYKPPFGYPRFVNLPNIRRLAATPFVDMCTTTIIDELCSIDWEITVEDGYDAELKKDEVEHVKSFFLNPNTNKESFNHIRRKYLRDILEVDAGVINKIFNIKGDMVELVARDGATFTKNPDIHGMFTDREDLILEQTILPDATRMSGEPGTITAYDAREKAAYFQYGWITGARPVPFGKKEIIWLERNPRSDSIYGRSPMEILETVVQTLLYSVESHLEYFNDNMIPKGVIGLEGLSSDEIKEFAEQWKEATRTKDAAGNWKRRNYRVPMVNTKPTFERIQFSNAELELLEQQKWFSKIVWACYGVTSTELGYTEDAKGMANQIVQSGVFKKKAINPLLRLEEFHINNEIVSEFGYEGIKFKFQTFDIDEETKKVELYDKQVKAGIKTVNEIRREEGYEEVDWGDDPPSWAVSQNTFNMGEKNPQENQNPQDNKEKKPKESEKEQKSIVNNPLALRENEVPDEDDLKKAIIHVLKLNQKKINELISQEAGKLNLNEIKSVDDIAKKVKEILSFLGLKAISDAVIRTTFLKGWEDAEKTLNMNFMPNKSAIDYIQKYTFENIKGMTDEIANDLRQELERGIMNGEGVVKMKERVNKVFDVGENRAGMIARTETNRAENIGKLQAIKESKVDFNKQWITHFDDRTSELCKRLDGQIVGINENFKDKISGWEGPSPPSHVNCRSSVGYLRPEDEKNNQE